MDEWQQTIDKRDGFGWMRMDGQMQLFIGVRIRVKLWTRYRTQHRFD